MDATNEAVPFNRPRLIGTEFEYIDQAMRNLHISGNGPFTDRSRDLLERRLGCARVLLTPSGTAALELGALLLRLGHGDEVIMPSFTFPTTASAVALRGAIPVFVDVRSDTLNIDAELAAAAISDRTKAILPVHYAGVGCEMEVLNELAAAHDLTILEDAAHAIGATWSGRELGTFGALGALSFHETKNVTCGEGGALIINDPALVTAAEILQEKGTNRSSFFRGEVDKYTWVDLGSSYALSDVNAAFLLAQLESLDRINAARRAIWDRYHEGFGSLAARGLARLPIVPHRAEHNGHLFHLLLADGINRDAVIATARRAGVDVVFHYVPLHSSPAGMRLGRTAGSMEVTDRSSAFLLRMPLWLGMDEAATDRVVAVVSAAIADAASAPAR